VGEPAGATINGTTGVFSWTPAEVQGPGNYTFTVRVSDGVTHSHSSVTVHVNEVNAAPALATVGDESVMLGSSVAFTATATDSDLPANSLAFSLAAGAPAGASINPATGQFAWSPTLAQAGIHNITVRVTDNGTPSLGDSETITVAVNFGVCVLYNQSATHKKGSTIPIKLNLCDAFGNNLSSLDLVVQATNITKLDNSVSPFAAEDSGNANPDLDFRFAGGSYIFNLSTKSSYFGQGTWTINFTVNGVPNAAYFARFDIK